MSLPPPLIAAPRPPLLPEWLSRRSLLWWAGTLPQVILLFVNLHAYGLIAGELSGTQSRTFLVVFVLELLVLLGVSAAALPLRGRRLISWQMALPLMLAAVAYLWIFMVTVDAAIPTSVPTWMLSRELLVYYQFIFIMPMAFYTGLWLASEPLKLTSSQEAGLLAATLIGLPLLVLALSQAARFAAPGQVPEYFFFVVFTVGTIVVLAAFARACVVGFVAAQSGPPGVRWTVLFLIGLAGPLGGLWLNVHIPFPEDFQSASVYALAALNGVVLLVSGVPRFAASRALWLTQCALFSFTLYFFLVFLPFLPLSLLAMVIYGSGFLILAPTALFLLHGQRLLEGFAREARRSSRGRATLLATLAIAVLPALFVGETLWDRVVLRSALDYVFVPDYRHMDRFRGSPNSVRRSLEHLRDFKAGLQLPFLSGFYNWAVFDNLVLPEEKINAIHQAFFGTNLPPAPESQISFFNGRPNRSGVLRERSSFNPPPSTVRLEKITPITKADGPCERTRFALELQGTTDGPNEFVAEIRIPEGVFVSGFWLTIGNERVPGRLFEKKAALWVYQQITSTTRRDPAILVYKDAHTLELRVFPITGKERRYAELEVLYPQGTHPEVSIGNMPWHGEGVGPATSLALTREGASALVLTPEAVAQLPRAERTPYLHFIIDRSTNGVLPDDEIASSMREAALKFPAAQEAMVTWANYQFTDVAPEPAPIVQLCAAPLPKRPAKRGGFLGERAMKRALLTYQEHLAHAAAGDPWIKRFPIFILLGSVDGSAKFTNDLALLEQLAPDAGRFYTTPEGSKIQSFDFKGSPRGQMFNNIFPVALLKVGDAVAACALDGHAPALVNFEPTKAERAVSVLDGAAFRPLAVTTTLPADLPYSRGIAAAQRALALTYNPSLGSRGLREIVELSRETGILLTGTSYVVMENSAQWEILKRKEEQKLKGHSALEFEQTPEPTTGLLLLAGSAALFGRWRRARPAPNGFPTESA